MKRMNSCMRICAIFNACQEFIIFKYKCVTCALEHILTLGVVFYTINIVPTCTTVKVYRKFSNGTISIGIVLYRIIFVRHLYSKSLLLVYRTEPKYWYYHGILYRTSTNYTIMLNTQIILLQVQIKYFQNQLAKKIQILRYQT